MYIKIKFTDGKSLRGFPMTDCVKFSTDGISIYWVGCTTTLYPWSTIRKVYIKPQKEYMGGRV